MNSEQMKQLIEAAMQEVDMLTALLQGAQSRLKGLLAIKPEDGPPEPAEPPQEPSRGAELLQRWQDSQMGTFGDDDD